MVKPITVCNVRWSSPHWVVSCEDGSFTQSKHHSREEAIWEGRQHAHKHRPSVLRIHRANGSLDIEHPYRAGLLY
ncbi:MAG: hypothetical protein DMD58_00900 [Gemmatimonadetes bacterium]|nr:MAG: hypothetical protein DMD58_00900 [Gemmatimonadota bacterium]